ncbi:CdaR family protein [Alkalibacillus aidingensis]|uniref:CdaR family protein n=1 Tax=Alkalibacillus aidingensis TaxID=2747607 RepID=UPI0016611DA1|nr:CdaR family protein [Alkalibacillus aidingensis]
MDNWIRSPWFTRVVSLFLAILLYTTVAIDEANTSRSSDIFLPTASTDTEMMENVPLQVVLDEEDYVVRGVPDVVNVTVEGPRSVITQTVRQRNFDVLIDLNGLGPGEHQVEIEHSGISNQLSVYTEPQTVDVTIEERSSVTLPVEVDYFGREDIDETQVFAGPPEVIPSEVEVTGSSAEIDRIAMVKAIVSFTELSQDGIAHDAPVRVYDTQGNELSVYVDPSTVDVEADVSMSEKRYPLTYETTGELPDDLILQDINMNPVSATVFGSIDRLNDINLLEAVQVDLSDITETTTVDVDLPLPRGTTRIEPNTVEVEVVVDQAVEDLVEDVEIEIENVTEEQEVTFIEPDEPIIDVMVSGTSDDLDNLDPDDIRAWIDADGYVEGEFYIPVQLEGPEDIEVTTDLDRIRVRID